MICGSWLRTLATAVLATAAITAVSEASAQVYEFSPISTTLSTSGTNARSTFTITNPGQDPIALELSMFRRDLALDGQEIRAPEDEDFIIIPPQLVVPGGASQIVRLQWIGAPSLATEQSFRMIVRQLPIDFGGQADEGLLIDLLLNFEVSVYVTPPNAAPEIAVAAVTRPAPGIVSVELENRGTGRGLIAGGTITLSAAGTRLVLDQAALAPPDVVGTNMLAGARRRFDFAVPGGFPPGAATATIDLVLDQIL